MQNVKTDLEISFKPTYKVDPAVADRLFMIDKKIVFFKEYPKPTAESAAFIFNEIEKMTAHLDQFFLFIDLTEASRPKGKTRKTINDFFSSMAHRFQHCCFITTNPMIKVALRFVIHYSNITSFSIHSTKEEAFKIIEDVK